MSLSYRVKCVSYRNYIHLPSDCIREMLQFWHCTLDCDPSLVSLISRQVQSQLTRSPVHLDVAVCLVVSKVELIWAEWGLRTVTVGGSWREALVTDLQILHWERRGELLSGLTPGHTMPSLWGMSTQGLARTYRYGPVLLYWHLMVTTWSVDIHSLLILCIARSLLNLQSPSIFYVI